MINFLGFWVYFMKCLEGLLCKWKDIWMNFLFVVFVLIRIKLEVILSEIVFSK